MFQRDDFSTRLLELGVKPGMRVLDVGCGNGEFTRLAAEVLGANGQLIGIDQNSGALSQAKGVESLLPNSIPRSGYSSSAI
ncbi:ubiquinone/menaquinone biosynthesis C-methylase UbiE [Streptococcus gallinaceus]|uniref:methyltransferase domain-containing protein n=1 Tax=Streptococcus gallinaceus TaxID=165758 RepID=UPI0029FB4736|nr:ubiquinone/menaquinone biosynthesis C-methylase UbiE [Streptococcus gallinaceus]MCP1769473.1 ubiquinone/menaquinone biosynthesis C-methylase UbiE [Streptococcus gallinaceus]